MYSAQVKSIITQIKSLKNDEKRLVLTRFFKTGIGQYAEGDIFMGISNPQVRCLVKALKKDNVSLADCSDLILHPIHEIRLLGLLLLQERFNKASESDRDQIAALYLSHTKGINNWDLVDLSAVGILGRYLYAKDNREEVLTYLADSTCLWEQRIALISTLYFIRKGQYEDIFRLVLKLKNHPHDLIHKAMGWMLREVGKKGGLGILSSFLELHALSLPRTSLRYAIERYPESQRKAWLLRK